MIASEIQKKIKKTMETIHDLEKVQRHSQQLENELRLLQSDLIRIDNKLDKEIDDIENLENLSVKGLFYKILGSKEEQIEKERQEYLQTALRKKDMEKQIHMIDFEIGLLKRKSGNLSILNKELGSLKQKRQRELLKSGSELGSKLTIIIEKQDVILLEIKETNEARQEGEQSLKDLNAVISHLNKAKDWGNWDMMGKGRVADYFKKDAMDKARDISLHAQRSLTKFERELRDIGEDYLDFEINIEATNGFLDFLFDNLISDWIVQQKIKNSLSNIKSIKNQTTNICKKLDLRLNSLDEKHSKLEEEKNDILIS